MGLQNACNQFATLTNQPAIFEAGGGANWCRMNNPAPNLGEHLCYFHSCSCVRVGC
jgi:hypothetical protein